MISGVSYFDGTEVTRLRSEWWIIIKCGKAEGLNMAKKNASQPMNPFHPGDITQAAFARKIGWTKARLNEFVRGKRGVTADAALDLGEALGTSARLWMNLQSTWDLSQPERRRRAA
jgi:addiction module HigA family antidote